MSIGKKPVLTFMSIAAKSIARLVVNKIFAVYLGTPGIALLAHFQNLIGILTQLPNDGVNRGLSHLLQSSKNASEKSKLTGAALTYNIILFSLMASIILIFNDYFFGFFIHTIDEGYFYLIFFLAVLVLIINLFLQAFILSLKNAAIYTLSNILGIALLLIIVYFGARTISIEYALLAFGVGQAVSILVTLVIILQYKSAEGLSLYFSSRSFKKLSEFLLIVFSVLIFSKLVDFGVRHYAISEYGLKLAGLWQAVVKISDSYMSLFIATVGVVFYPQVSALVFDTDQLRNYIKDVLYIVVPVTVVGLILIYIFRIPILSILFTPDFEPAHYLMKFHLIGDFFGIISYLLIYIVSAQARTATFISLQFGSAVLYIALIAFFSSFYGIEALPLAHAGRFVIFFMVLTIINRRILF
jgi:O-antigen/teichoic acid export membrane protein